MRYRIIEENETFFPQVKGILFWKYFHIADTSGMTTVRTDGIIGTFSKENAQELIRRHAESNTTTYHEAT